jgi:ankyrin repeat protein
MSAHHAYAGQTLLPDWGLKPALDSAREMLEQGAPLSEVEITLQLSALHLAAYTGDVKLLAMLLNCPDCDINKVDSLGMTPLMVAAQGFRLTPQGLLSDHDSPEVVELLLSASPDLSCVNYTGQDVVMIAASHGLKRILIALCTAALQPLSARESPCSPLSDFSDARSSSESRDASDATTSDSRGSDGAAIVNSVSSSSLDSASKGNKSGFDFLLKLFKK